MQQEDFTELEKYARLCCLSKSEYLRLLIHRYRPKIPPAYSYYEMAKELKAIGNNLNQLAISAHELEIVDAHKYKTICSYLFEKIEEIETAVTVPERILERDEA